MNMQHSIKDPAKELPDEPVESLLLPEETLGSVLQRARLAKRLDIDNVTTRLRFKSGVIQALENNNLQALGAPVFVRMYLLRYAQLLDLPEHDVLARYKALGLDEPPPLRVNQSIKPQAKASDLRWLGYPIMFIVLGSLIWTGSQQLSIDPLLSKLGLLEATPTSPNVEVPDPAPQPITSAPDTAPINPETHLSNATTELTSPVIASDNISNNLPETSPLTPEPVNSDLSPPPELASPNLSASSANESPVASIPSAETILALNTRPLPDSPNSNPDSNTQADPNPTTTSTEPLIPATLDGKYELTLEFSDDCWVEIKDSNGERLVYGIAKANEIRTVSGIPPFAVKLGNAHAAHLKLNGQDVDKALYIPRRGSVSRFSLEAPDTTSNQG